METKRLTIEDEEIIEMKNYQLEVVENNPFKRIGGMKEGTNKWDDAPSTSGSMNTKASLSSRKRPAKVLFNSSSNFNPLK